ncbi:MAG: hypothetical protein R2881_07815 [Eubacteriales bacterium]
MRREHALKFTEMGANGLLLPNTESASRRRCSWTAPNTRRWGTAAYRYPARTRIFAKVEYRAYMARANEENILLARSRAERASRTSTTDHHRMASTLR